MIQYHGLVIGAILLVIFGVIKEMNDEPHTPGPLMKVGVILVLVAWAVLCSWTLLSWLQPPENTAENKVFADGSIVSLPLLYA